MNSLFIKPELLLDTKL